MDKKTTGNIADVFFLIAMVFIILSFVVKKKGNEELADTFFWVYGGLLLAALIVRFIGWLFPKLGRKPTREELEQRVHGE